MAKRLFFFFTSKRRLTRGSELHLIYQADDKTKRRKLFLQIHRLKLLIISLQGNCLCLGQSIQKICLKQILKLHVIITSWACDKRYWLSEYCFMKARIRKAQRVNKLIHGVIFLMPWLFHSNNINNKMSLQ